MVPTLEEKVDDASCKSLPEMDDPVLNSNEDNGFEYEPESTHETIKST